MPNSKIKSNHVSLSKGTCTTIKLGSWNIKQLADGKLSFEYKGIHQCVLEPLT